MQIVIERAGRRFALLLMLIDFFVKTILLASVVYVAINYFHVQNEMDSHEGIGAHEEAHQRLTQLENASQYLSHINEELTLVEQRVHALESRVFGLEGKLQQMGNPL